MKREGKAEQAARWLAEHGGPVSAAAREFGVTQAGVWHAWNRLYQVPTPVEMARRAMRERALELIRSGESIRSTATKIGTSRSFVVKAMKRAGVRSRNASGGSLPGANRHSRVAEAVAMLEAGSSLEDAAREAKVKERSILLAIKRRVRSETVGE